MVNPNETILSAVGYYDPPDVVAIEEALRFASRLPPTHEAIVFKAKPPEAPRLK